MNARLLTVWARHRAAAAWAGMAFIHARRFLLGLLDYFVAFTSITVITEDL